MTWQEDAEVVQEWLRLGIDPGHPSVYFDALARLTAALEEYKAQWADVTSPEFLDYWQAQTTMSAGTAIKQLLAALEAALRENEGLANSVERLSEIAGEQELRAETAEQCVAELEAALREIVRLHDNATEHFNDLGMAEIARAALEEK